MKALMLKLKLLQPFKLLAHPFNLFPIPTHTAHHPRKKLIKFKAPELNGMNINLIATIVQSIKREINLARKCTRWQNGSRW